MNTTIIRKNFWLSDDFINLHQDSKAVYNYLLSGPDKNYINIFKFNKNIAVTCTGISSHSIEAGLSELEHNGFIEIKGQYVALLMGHSVPVGGQYGASNTAREIAALPVDIREHFNLDTEGIIEKKDKKPKAPGPKPETIKDIIEHQPEALREPLRELVADRIERNRAPTTRAVKGWISKLEKMYPDSLEKRVASIEQTIEKGWMGLFEVKEEVRERTFM
jgi:hypothetical protein